MRGLTVTLDLTNGHAFDPEFSQSRLNLLQLEWFNDRLDFFHVG